MMCIKYIEENASKTVLLNVASLLSMMVNSTTTNHGRELLDTRTLWGRLMNGKEFEIFFLLKTADRDLAKVCLLTLGYVYEHSIALAIHDFGMLQDSFSVRRLFSSFSVLTVKPASWSWRSWISLGMMLNKLCHRLVSLSWCLFLSLQYLCCFFNICVCWQIRTFLTQIYDLIIFNKNFLNISV